MPPFPAVRAVHMTNGRWDMIADLETDKVVLEVPAPAAGVLQTIHITAGTIVKSGELLATIEVADAAAAATAAPAATAKVAPAVPQEPKLGPAAQRVAEELGLPRATIAAAAKGGRVSKSDLVSAATATPPPARTAPLARAPVSVPAIPAVARGARAERRVPMTRLRQRIAERLVLAQSTQALLTTFNEVDLTHINELRGRYKEAFEKQHGVKLGFMSFFVKASIEGLKRFPPLNAAVEGSDIAHGRP